MSKRIVRVPERGAILLHKVDHLHSKERGSVGEVAFLQRALLLGYTCSQPFGENAQFDWVVGGASGRMKRVQVKTSFRLKHPQNLYAVAAFRTCGKRYKPKDLDLLAVYIAPLDVWYIIPSRVFCPRTRLFFRPYPIAQDRWRKYREAWWRLGKVPPPHANLQGRPAVPPAGPADH